MLQINMYKEIYTSEQIILGTVKDVRDDDWF